MYAPETAIHSPSMPCNPRPFLNRINELIEERGTEAIQSPEAQACLWILLNQSYGQLFRIDAMEEYSRLTKLIPNPGF